MKLASGFLKARVLFSTGTDMAKQDIKETSRNTVESERRTGEDRRKTPPPLFSRYLFIGRRKQVRRKEDQRLPYQLDRHGLDTLIFFLLFLVLSMVDAVLTLQLTGRNAVEMNPIMAYFLRRGPTAFILAKYCITSLSVLLILSIRGSHLFQPRLRAVLFFLLLLAPFSLVVPYQLHLLLSVD